MPREQTTPGQKYVVRKLSSLWKQMPPDHPIFGSIHDGLLRLPREKQKDDRRRASWPKKLMAIGMQVLNNPTSRTDCWFVPATKKDGYHEIKISKDGSRGKYRTHRVLRIFVEHDKYDIVNNRDTSLHAAHRCGRGKAAAKGGNCCINPYHVHFTNCITNQSHKGCMFARTNIDCPHRPKCIKTDEAGMAIKNTSA